MKLIRTGIGLLLYARLFICIIPGVPEWVGRIFPTYYMIGPIMDISQSDASCSQVASNIYVLIASIVLLIAILGWVARRESAKGVKILSNRFAD
jgi:ABC-2 type transport system permease protein